MKKESKMNGLTNEQVVENRQKYGSNKLPEPKLKNGIILQKMLYVKKSL